ncbi:bifunctional 3-(3-hydroxy-phenyl)propionate/3-hydroxycinnamic acid hydroxylase MhpA [Nocardia asiatica]|uniref:bifunctional 3-(3-hydroxy-phenyl)propionate/3-hydroxycinnamic acid hydroxylase MhpA n=1 Tax=Nocardia asiatica TaxID=209252 RepID=UPI00031DD632|nr:bifunctional 3-(3-hydroxy-phenyl)propionate/3-hydroxycinnamic acid hydroxylase [Nocardia asiatica]
MTPSSTKPQEFDADVVVVGAGPVGLYTAIRLADAGHNVIVVDKQPKPYPLPRAITFDDEIARLLSELGIDGDHDPQIDCTDDWVLLRNGAREIIGRLDWRGVTPAGWHRLYWFHQPELEVRFAAMLAGRSRASLVRSWRVTEVHRTETCVTVSGAVTEPDGTVRPAELRCRYLVGCDGANSVVREQAGLEMTDLGFHFDWLICDIVPIAPETFDPMVFDTPMSQICDPTRPTTMVPAGPGRRRWEFMALPGEYLDELNTAERAWELLAVWGVTPESARLERHVVWRFQAKYAAQWRAGRILLAGDAAHLMPPFAGQGMCAGIRDGASLAWRLDLILRGLADDTLLDSYTPERQYHVSHFMHVSMELGQAICVTDPEIADARDAAMKAAMRDPSLAPPPPPPLKLGPGVWREGDPQAGHLSDQGSVTLDGRTGRFDEITGRGWVLIGRDHDPSAYLGAPVAQAFAAIGGRGVAIGTTAGAANDVDGTYAAWFDRLQADVVLVRPDFYVAAAVSRAETDTAVQEILEKVRVLEPSPASSEAEYEKLR